MHTFLFSELISRKITFQLQDFFFRELISQKLHIPYSSFVIQRITWKIVLGILFLENLISVTWNNVFGMKFAETFSGWSALLGEFSCELQDRLIFGAIFGWNLLATEQAATAQARSNVNMLTHHPQPSIKKAHMP